MGKGLLSGGGAWPDRSDLLVCWVRFVRWWFLLRVACELRERHNVALALQKRGPVLLVGGGALPEGLGLALSGFSLYDWVEMSLYRECHRAGSAEVALSEEFGRLSWLEKLNRHVDLLRGRFGVLLLDPLVWLVLERGRRGRTWER